MPAGPRIIFKDDRESRIGRGCILHAGHFRPEVIRIVYAAAVTAPDGLLQNRMVVSEGWRSIRTERDLHEELRAFDISLNTIVGDEPERRRIGGFWAGRMGAELGHDYDIEMHGTGTNLHLHAELDP